jgi:prolyl-tRNA synthetase
MDCYSTGTRRLMAVVLDQSHDQQSMIPPPSITAPKSPNPQIVASAESLVEELAAKGHEIVCDHAEESTSVEFNHADLIGIALRLVFSHRTLEARGVEVKLHHEMDHQMVTLQDLKHTIQKPLG